MPNQNDHPWVGCVNIITDNEGRILLMKRSEECSMYPGYWGMVGGFIDWGETGAEAAKREAKEEIGVEIEVEEPASRVYADDSREGPNSRSRR